MRFQLKQNRKAAWELEEEARRWEHDMKRATREQLRKIDQIKVELKHVQDIDDVIQTTSAIYWDTVEAKINRLETERVVYMDEIFSLRLVMEEMQAHMQEQVASTYASTEQVLQDQQEVEVVDSLQFILAYVLAFLPWSITKRKFHFIHMNYSFSL